MNLSENIMKITLNCNLCNEKYLNVVAKDAGLLQCLYCGYSTSNKFKIKEKLFGLSMSLEEKNESYKALPADMKKWSIVVDQSIWIPSFLTLPTAMIYPIDDSGKMKWAYAELVDVPLNILPKDKKEEYKNPNGGYYEKTYDTDNAKIFDEFYMCLYSLNKIKKNDKIQS